MWILTFSRPEVWLNLVDSETGDSDLHIFIPKLGLDIATADKFDKTNNFKINNNNGKVEPDTYKKHNE